MNSNNSFDPSICEVCCIPFNKTYRAPVLYGLKYEAAYKTSAIFEEMRKCFMCLKCENFMAWGGPRFGDFKDDHKFRRCYRIHHASYPRDYLTKISNISCDDFIIDYNNFYTAIYVKNLYGRYSSSGEVEANLKDFWGTSSTRELSHDYVLKQKFNYFEIKFNLPTDRVKNFYVYYIIREKEEKPVKIFGKKDPADEKEILLQVTETETKSIKRKFFGKESYIRHQSRDYVDLTKMTDNFNFIKFFIECVVDISKLGDIGSICSYDILEYLEFLNCMMEFNLLKKTIMVILDIKDFGAVRIVPKKIAYSDYLTDFIKLASLRRVEQLGEFTANKHLIWINGIKAVDFIKHESSVEAYLLNQLVCSELWGFIQRMNMFEMKFDSKQPVKIDLQIAPKSVFAQKVFEFLHNDDQDVKTEKLKDIIDNHYEVLRPGNLTTGEYFKIISGNKNRYKISRALAPKIFPAYTGPNWTAAIKDMCQFADKNVVYYELFQEHYTLRAYLHELKYIDCLALFFEDDV